MSTAILDLDFVELPPSLSGLAPHTRAMIFLRLRGRRVGQAVVPLQNGGCTDLRGAVLRHADATFRKALLRDYLEVPIYVSEPRALPSTTVAICAASRRAGLQRCLERLAEIRANDLRLLVVDYGPAPDEIRTLVSDYTGVRYVRDDSAELTAARNRALREADTDIVAFISDEVVPDPEWLPILLQSFSDPLVLAAVGRTQPPAMHFDAQSRFLQFTDRISPSIRSVYDPAVDNPLRAWIVSDGSSMAVRRSALDAIGLFDAAFDGWYGAEGAAVYDLFRRILAAGYLVAYEPEALVWSCDEKAEAPLTHRVHRYEAGRFAVLTKALCSDRDLSALGHMLRLLGQAMALAGRSVLRRPDAVSRDVAAARLRGALSGPFAYLRPRRP